MSVRIVFLGGLGEIGRNCFCIEVDGRILVVDCGIMFPDADMPGVDLVLPDFTYLRDNADRVEAVRPHPRARGPRRRPGLPAPRRLGADLRLGAVARASPGTASTRRACSTAPSSSRSPTASGAGSVRSTASSSRSRTRCRTASRSRTSRPRARSSTPATSSSTSRRSTVATPTSRCSARSRAATVASGCCSPTRRTPSGPGFTPSESTVGAAMRALFREHADKRFIVASFASHLHRVEQVARGRDRARAQGRVRRPLDDAERGAGARARLHRPARVRGHRHRGDGRATRRARSASSAPVRRASR